MASTSGFKKAKKQIKAVAEEYEDQLKEAVDSGTADTVTDSRKNLKTPNRYGSPTVMKGTLLGSIYDRQRSEGHTHTYEAIVDAPHGGVVEWGSGKYNTQSDARKSFRAPTLSERLINNIKAWILIKGISPYNADMDVDQLAFVIARSIADDGTRPQPYFEPAVEKNVEEMKRRAKTVHKSVW